MAASAKSPLVTMSNGRTIPLVGLGTWKSKPGEVYQAVKDAILEGGYRHIDCAFVYQNEEEVGRALSEVLSSGAVKREELFITSKCWNTFHSTPLVLEAVQKTLKALRLDYLDLYLIHWPFGFQEGGDIMPKDDKGNTITSDVDYLDTWKGMEQVYEKGWAKSIGLSNFNAEQTSRVLANAKVRPVCNQVECHPYLSQNELIAFSAKEGITIVAYSPLGSPDRPWAQPGEPSLLEEPAIVEIAKKHNKSAGQILIKWQAQRGVVVIPKSVTKSRILSNIDIFDFELTPEEVKTIESFNRGHRFVALEWVKDHKYYPFAAPF